MPSVLAKAQPNTPNLWLKSQRFDRCFFQVSGLICLLLLVPYYFFKEASVIPIYNLYLVLFGLPHNYLTWATILPKRTRSTIDLNAIMVPALICLIICLALPFVSGHPLKNWILTLITMASLWHAYRQHHGIAKVYDSIQVKRTGDSSLYSDRKSLDLFFLLASWLIVVWAFTHPEIKYLLSADDFYMLVYPQIPMLLFYCYIGLTISAGIYALKRNIYDRWKSGKFIPWPQITLMTIAIATYIVPYAFIPIEAMPLAVAIGTIYHNIQYFGFVWLFERERSQELAKISLSLEIPQKLALLGSWKGYFSLSLLYSFVMVAVYLISPKSFGLVLIYYIAFAHYIIDGYIWKRQNNSFLKKFTEALAFPGSSSWTPTPELGSVPAHE
jgi:hypothetical protein